MNPPCLAAALLTIPSCIPHGPVPPARGADPQGAWPRDAPAPQRTAEAIDEPACMPMCWLTGLDAAWTGSGWLFTVRGSDELFAITSCPAPDQTATMYLPGGPYGHRLLVLVDPPKDGDRCLTLTGDSSQTQGGPTAEPRSGDAPRDKKAR